MRVGDWTVLGRRVAPNLGVSEYEVLGYFIVSGAHLELTPEQLGRVYRVEGSSKLPWRHTRSADWYRTKWQAMFELADAWLKRAKPGCPACGLHCGGDCMRPQRFGTPA